MRKRVLEKRTEWLALLGSVLGRIPYRITYLPSYYLCASNGEVVKMGTRLIWTNSQDSYVLRLTDTVAYSTEIPKKRTFVLINKQNKADREMWSSVKGEV
jgi:hypothetical protein